MLLNSSEILNRKTPQSVWAVSIIASLWTPVIHTFRLLNTPEGQIYTFVQGRDPSGWIWAIESPKEYYLSSIVLDRDINIFFRADSLAHIFVPYGWIAQLFNIPSPMMLILIEALWNGLCALATYHFFLTFFKKESIAFSALILVYFSSGISGMILLINWLWQGVDTGVWTHSIVLGNWIGENHAFSYEFYEGNQLVTVTNLNRPYYMMARFLGLCSLISLHHVSYSGVPMMVKKRNCLYASLYLFICGIIHPASALIFGVMIISWTIIYALSVNQKESSDLYPRYYLQAGIATFLGLIVSAIIWKLYQQIPEVKTSTEQYIKQLYNAEATAVWLAILPMISICFIIILRTTVHKTFYITLLGVSITATIGLSEFIITDYSVKIRLFILIFTVVLFFIIATGKRSYLLNLLRQDERIKIATLFGIWVFTIIAISVSPHHDALKMIEGGYLNLGELNEFSNKLLEMGSLIYAARFKLGIWVPLSGLCAYLVYEFWLEKIHSKIIILGILAISSPSLLLYTWMWTRVGGDQVGYISKSTADAHKAIRNESGRNVMCAYETGVYLLNGANKRPLLGYGEDRTEERKKDVRSFFQTTDENIHQEIIKKYKIDFIFLSPNERALGGNESNFDRYFKVFDSQDVQVFRTKMDFKDHN
jgi:hypothetical protein